MSFLPDVATIGRRHWFRKIAMAPQVRHKQVEAEVQLKLGRVQVVRNVWHEPIDVLGAGHEHHLELTLLPVPKTARACFLDHWGPNRYEPLGPMFMLPAEQSIRAISECSRQNSIICSFAPPAVAQWFGQDLEWTDSRLQGVLNLANTRIRNLLFAIGEEVRKPGFASETLIELMAAQIAIELSRHIMGMEEAPVAGGLSPWCMRLIEQRLADDPIPPSLTELAGLCNLSVRHLTRAFRASRGRSIGNYIAEHRVNYAKRLLESGMSVKSVAYTTGFSAPSNFTAAFVKATGETPTQYRLRATGGAMNGSLRQHDIH